MFADLNAPESYVLSWIKALQEKYFKDSNIAETVVEWASGKHKLFSFTGFSFSWAKGLRGMIPGLVAGPVLSKITALVGRILSAIKSAVRWLFG